MTLSPCYCSTTLRILLCISLLISECCNHLMSFCAPAVQINSATNDTGALFNWHPFLMALAFPLLMGEALLAYRAPLAPNLSV